MNDVGIDEDNKGGVMPGTSTDQGGEPREGQEIVGSLFRGAGERQLLGPGTDGHPVRSECSFKIHVRITRARFASSEATGKISEESSECNGRVQFPEVAGEVRCVVGHGFCRVYAGGFRRGQHVW